MATFDAHAGTYEDSVQSSISFAGRELEFFTARKVDALTEVIARRLGPPSEVSVLDLGCGTGVTDALLSPRVGTLFGIDPAGEAVGQAGQRGTGAHYCTGDALQLPYGSASFDVAVAICVLHHVPPEQRPAAMAELRRVVRPGGLVVVFEHNPLNPATRVAVSRCEFDVGVELLTQGTSKRLLESAGLQVIEARGIIYTTSQAGWAARLDRLLGGIPFGAQHYVAARRPAEWSA
jgi:ubiquinone/menaquinone biosynthesis C-methylase UbiE